MDITGQDGIGKSVDDKNNKVSFKNINFSLSTTKIIIILSILGLIVYILTSNLLATTIENYAYKIALEIGKILSSTLISTGVLSIILNISSMKSTVADTVLNTYKEYTDNFFKGNFKLDNYDDKTLYDLQKRIVLHRNNNKMDMELLNNSVYVLEKNLANLTKELYWEYNSRTIVIIPDKKNFVFRKKVTSEYKTMIVHFRLNNFTVGYQNRYLCYF